MKSWFYSKTIWVNILTTFAGVLLLAKDTLSMSQETQGIILFLAGTINIVLRLNTRTAIGSNK